MDIRVETLENSTGLNRTPSNAPNHPSSNLHPQRHQYSLLSHLVGDMTALLQRNGADNRVHRVCENDVDSGAVEIVGLAGVSMKRHAR